MLWIGQGYDVNKPACLIPCLSSPCHFPWDILSLLGNTFLCAKVWTGQEGQERTGISPLVSGYVESDLLESAALIWDHSYLLLRTGLVLRVSTASVLLSLRLKDVCQRGQGQRENL